MKYYAAVSLVLSLSYNMFAESSDQPSLPTHQNEIDALHAAQLAVDSGALTADQYNAYKDCIDRYEASKDANGNPPKLSPDRLCEYNKAVAAARQTKARKDNQALLNVSAESLEAPSPEYAAQLAALDKKIAEQNLILKAQEKQLKALEDNSPTQTK